MAPCRCANRRTRRRFEQRNTDTEGGFLAAPDGITTVIGAAMTAHLSGIVTGNDTVMSGRVADIT
jgi:hypothetical protein